MSKLKEIISYSKLNKNGTATIPAKIRESMGMDNKSELKWILKDGILQIKPLKL